MSTSSHLGNAGLFLVPLGLSAIFLLDVVGPFEPFISVLYVPVLILAAKLFDKAGVVYVGVVCLVLTSVSYLLANVEGFDSVTMRQYGAIVSTVIIATALLVGLRKSHPRKLV